METDKFEQQLEKIFKKREINPTSKAWERVAEQLDAEQGRKKKGFLWYGIAASLVGLAMIGIFYMKDPQRSDEKGATVVDRSEQKPGLIIQDANKLDDEDIVEQSTEIVESGSAQAAKGLLSAPQLQKVYPASRSIVKNNLEVSNRTINKKATTRAIEIKMAEVLKKADRLGTGKDLVTDGETDSLLRIAQQELLANELFQIEPNIDATTLLNEVEHDLDQSFRSQIFETLKGSFLKARTAVAERNN
jgi:hypothetical protein